MQRHYLTRKHLKDDSGLQKVPKSSAQYFCECGNFYKYRQGLSKHKKNCQLKILILDKTNENEKEKEKDQDKENQKLNVKEHNVDFVSDNMIDLFKQQIQENKELKYFMLEQQKQIMEQNKQIMDLAKDKSLHITNNNCHTTNKFNMRIFLNEQCKDALNLDDFVNSLHLKITDLEMTARLGYVEGISKIFVRGLQELDIYKRPVHCSDLKREILYIKDENKWEKEDDENKKIKTAIQKITHKNIKQISSWVEQNPCCKDVNSKKNDEYMRLISNCMMGENGDEQNANLNKIISRVAKEVIINK
jgi:hypothetical protein